MKKVLLSLSLALALGLAACGGVDSKISRLEEITNEYEQMAEKAMKGEEVDAKKIEALQKEYEDLVKEVQAEKANLTDEQKAKLDKLGVSYD